MNNGFAEAARALNAASSIVITIHVQPDGDAFGSLLAMSKYLRKMGKRVCATWGEEIVIPAQYEWMPGLDQVDDYGKCIDAEVMLALDCANVKRLGWMQEKIESFPTIINIDHHIDNSQFGTINIVDPEAAATCEIVYSLLLDMGAEIDQEIATDLYTGIVTDTGRFQYSNTKPSTLRIAAELTDKGVDPNQIFRKVYENISFSALKLLARILTRATYIEESKFVYSYICEVDLEESGLTMADTENFIDYLRTAKEAVAAAILKEAPDKQLRVSLRSKGNVDIGSIARERGGGGHKNAAGVTLNISVDEAVSWISGRLKEQLNTIQA